jgi:hypothetical protein
VTALSDANRARVRYHLGYQAASPGMGFSYGVPILSEPHYIFESACQNLIAENVPQVIKLLDTLDCIQDQMMNSAKRGYPAIRAEDVEPNLKEGDDLEREYVRWAYRLADILGCPVSPWAERFKAKSGAYNVSVR